MEKWDEWKNVIERAMDHRSEETLEQLLAVMEEDQAGLITDYAVFVLGFFPFSPRIEKVLLPLVNHRDGTVREQALSILVRESDDPQIKELVLQALRGSDEYMILGVLEGIQSKREKWQTLSSQIRPLLQHSNDEIKIEALAAFASLNNEDKVWQETHHLFQSFLQHPDRKIRIKVLSILSTFDLSDSQMKEQVIRRLDDSDEEVIIETLSIIEKKSVARLFL